jgi:hypothetical protein
MGPEWSALLGQLGPVGLVVAGGGAAALVLRWLLIAVVVLWSLRTDEKGRKHALGLLRLLGAGRRGRLVEGPVSYVGPPGGGEIVPRDGAQ